MSSRYIQYVCNFLEEPSDEKISNPIYLEYCPKYSTQQTLTQLR